MESSHHHHHHRHHRQDHEPYPEHLYYTESTYEYPDDWHEAQQVRGQRHLLKYPHRSYEELGQLPAEPEQTNSDYHRVLVPVTEDEANEGLDTALHASPNTPSPFWRCLLGENACVSKTYPICEELADLENQAYLFFKVMCLKSLQMLAAFVVTISVQITWSFKDKPKDYSPLVKIAKKYTWIVYVAFLFYLVLRLLVRFTHLMRKRFACFIVYILLTFCIMILAYVPGIAWELISASAVALTLTIAYFVIGLLPLISENMDVKRGCIRIQSFFIVLGLSGTAWYCLGGLLATHYSKVSLVYLYTSTGLQLFLHVFPTFLVGMIFVVLDLADIKHIFEGKKFPLCEDSWMLIAVYA